MTTSSQWINDPAAWVVVAGVLVACELLNPYRVRLPAGTACLWLGVTLASRQGAVTALWFLPLAAVVASAQLRRSVVNTHRYLARNFPKAYALIETDWPFFEASIKTARGRLRFAQNYTLFLLVPGLRYMKGPYNSLFQASTISFHFDDARFTSLGALLRRLRLDNWPICDPEQRVAWCYRDLHTVNLCARASSSVASDGEQTVLHTRPLLIVDYTDQAAAWRATQGHARAVARPFVVMAQGASHANFGMMTRCLG